MQVFGNKETKWSHSSETNVPIDYLSMNDGEKGYGII
jgi:hypothetical protein